MKPQTFTNKLKAKGFRRNASGLWTHPNYSIGFKPIANKVTIWHKRKNFDGTVVMAEVAPHKLESMDVVSATLTNDIPGDSNAGTKVAASPFKEYPTNITQAKFELYEPKKTGTFLMGALDERDLNNPDIAEDIIPNTGSGGIPSGGGSGGGGGASSSASEPEEENTFFQKYKWFIIASAVILFLIFNEQ